MFHVSQVWKEEVADSSSLSDFFDSSGDEFQSESATDISSAPRRIPGQHHSRSSGTHSAGVGRRARGQSVLHIQMQLAEFTLRTWLQSVGRSTSLEANRPYFVQILLGLEHIHKNSLIHRDLTPANVFIANKVSPRGEPGAAQRPPLPCHAQRQIIKIGDFGLSREMVSGDLPPGASLLPLCAPENKGTVSPRRQRGEWRENARSVTRGVGTTLYMSPEQRAGQPYDFKVCSTSRHAAIIVVNRLAVSAGPMPPPPRSHSPFHCRSISIPWESSFSKCATLFPPRWSGYTCCPICRP